MTTIQLTNSEITTLRCSTTPILVPEYKIAIHTPHTFGTIPPDYVVLNISNDDANLLFDGQHIISNGFILNPKDAITPRFSKDPKALTIHKSFKFTKTKLSASQLLELIFESYYIKLRRFCQLPQGFVLKELALRYL